MSRKRKPQSDVEPTIPDLCTVVDGEIYDTGVKALRPGDPDWFALTFRERCENIFPLGAGEVSMLDVDNYNPGAFEKNWLVRPPQSQEGTKLATPPPSHVPAPPRGVYPRSRGAQTRHHTPRCRARHCALDQAPGLEHTA